MSQRNKDTSSMLRIGTILRGIYRIDKYLSSGGFGNTYLATNTEFDEQVAIKEFFKRDINHRDNNQTSVGVTHAGDEQLFEELVAKFKKEARRIRQLNNEHIIRVHDLFEENGTAYYVMDYIDGESLEMRLENNNGPFAEDIVRDILSQVLDALKVVHDAGLWHLDLKPGNILVDKCGNIKLIDFGSSKQLDVQQGGGATALTRQAFTNGYAPREQMEENFSKYGPWTDIYALGATLYALLTKRHPPLPSDIDDDESADKHEALPFPDSVSDDMRKLILHMMKTNRTKRPQSIDEVITEVPVMSQPTIQSQSQGPQERAYSEETILASPSNTEAYKDEETILAEAPNEAGTPPQTIEDATHGRDYYADNGSNLKYVFIAIVILAIVIFFLFSIFKGEKAIEPILDCDSLEEVSDPIADDLSVDTVVVDYEEEKQSLNGYQTKTYNNGTYEGYLKDGEPHGKGTFVWTDGDKYVGDWNDGERTGKGTYYYSGAKHGCPYKYEGDFVKGERTGNGTEYLVGGDFYEGRFKDGNYEGTGTYYYAADYTYVTGIWKDNELVNKTEEGTWTKN